MKKPFFGFRNPDHDEKRKRYPLYCWMLMTIGLLTLIYLFITYVLIPVLAMMTVS